MSEVEKGKRTQESAISKSSNSIHGAQQNQPGIASLIMRFQNVIEST